VSLYFLHNLFSDGWWERSIDGKDGEMEEKWKRDGIQSERQSGCWVCEGISFLAWSLFMSEEAEEEEANLAAMLSSGFLSPLSLSLSSHPHLKHKTHHVSVDKLMKPSPRLFAMPSTNPHTVGRGEDCLSFSRYVHRVTTLTSTHSQHPTFTSSSAHQRWVTTSKFRVIVAWRCM